MFQIRELKTWDQSGFTDLFIEFNIGNGVREDKRSYLNKEDADDYIRRCERDYILIMFEKYVIHAQILINEGHKSFYQTPSRLEAMDKLIRANKWFNTDNIGIKTICEWVLKLEEDLIMILPSPNNNSRKSSENRLRDMIVFAKSKCNIKIDKREPVEIK